MSGNAKPGAGLTAKTADDFLGELWVECPACRGLAIIRLAIIQLAGDAADPVFAARRMVCTVCGATREQPAMHLSRPAMGLPLWFTAETRHGVLVAYNPQHLDYIEAYVAAALRRVEHTPNGPRNRTITSRLPLWVKQAKNRDEVLKTLGKMRARSPKP